MNKGIKSFSFCIVATMVLSSMIFHSTALAVILTFTQHYAYNEGTYYRARAVEAADIDEDGDMDIIVGDSYYDDLLWYDNNGSEVFTRRTIDSTYYRAAQIQVFDLDEDGDLDIIGGDNDNYAVFWWENDGSENFTEQTISTYGSDFAISDIDGDGDYDVVTPDWSGGIRWAKNDGSENFTDQVIDASLTFAWTACAGDLTGDTNVDIVFNRYNSNLHLLTNDGSENFSSSIIDTGSNTKTLACVSLDGDADLDIVVAQSVNGNILWFDNNGSGVFTEKVISSESLGTEDFEVIDFDADGDLDIVTADDGSNQMYWFENDGSESFTKHTVDSYYNGVTTVSVADIDGDSDLDVVGGSYENGQDLMWFEAAVDSTAPVVQTLSPADDATGVSTTANLVITFDENVDAESGASNDIVIKKTSDNSIIETIDAQDGKVTGSGTSTITINPAATLDEQMGYYVQIGADAFDDTSGNSYVGIGDTTSWSFTVGDFTSPTVLTLSPVDNATGVQANSDLIITFTENVDVESGNITIKRSSGDSTIETIDVTSGQVTGTGTSVITINPSVTLSSLTEYYVQIDASAFDDVNSNSYAGIADTTSWSFTAVKQRSSSTYVPAPTPSLGSVDLDGQASDSSTSLASAVGASGLTTVESGGDIRLQWSGAGIQLVNIYISYDGGGTYEFVDGPIMNVDNYSWRLSGDVDASSVMFKIEGTDLIDVIASIETNEILIESDDDSCDCDTDELVDQVDQDGESSEVGEAVDEIETVIEESVDESIESVEEADEEVTEGEVKIDEFNFDRDLTLGSEGEDVRALQKFLNNNGYIVADLGFGSPGNETAYFGELTRQALVDYQQDNDLPAFGYFGPLTQLLFGPIEVLVNEEVEEDVLEEVATSFDRDLGIGLVGEDVRELQEFLNENGYTVAESGVGSLGSETDYFGQLTQRALIKFQEAMDISPAAGYFGPVTKSFIE